MLYLDNAATTLKKPFCVYPGMLKNTILNSANAGRGGHFYSIRTSEKIYETAESLCTLLNITDPMQIAFTQNATYALNLAILGILDKDDHVIITQTEHNSVLRPVHRLCDYSVIKIDKNGVIDINEIEKLIKPNTKMIICTHASNVCGTIHPISEIAEVAHKNNLIFMVDGAQTCGCYPVDVKKENIDVLVFSGHKGLMTPMGVGGVYVDKNIKLKPVITGGTGSLSESPVHPDFMPDIFQSGTLNAPAIITAKKSIDFIIKETPEEIHKKEYHLATLLIEKLKNIKNVTVHGLSEGLRNGTVSFNIKNHDSVEIAEILNDEYKICTRGGWHCAYPAHIGLGTQKTGTVRASFGYFNSEKDAVKLTDAVFKIAKSYL